MSLQKLCLILTSVSSVGTSSQSGTEECFTVVCVDQVDAISQVSALMNNVYDEVRITSIETNDSLLSEVFRILKQGGKMLIEKSISSREAGQILDTDIKIAGFINSMVAKDSTTGDRFAIATKPNWEVGATATVRIEPSAVAVSNKWKMETSDLAEDDLVDENSLLNDGLQTKPVSGCGDDNLLDGASSGKKRACKNCTCGLLEEELNGTAPAENTNATPAEKLAKASGCGNCAKGDAFRCGSCPFLGKPAFEPGQEKVILNLAGNDDF